MIDQEQKLVSNLEQFLKDLDSDGEVGQIEKEDGKEEDKIQKEKLIIQDSEITRSIEEVKVWVVKVLGLMDKSDILAFI